MPLPHTPMQVMLALMQASVMRLQQWRREGDTPVCAQPSAADVAGPGHVQPPPAAGQQARRRCSRHGLRCLAPLQVHPHMSVGSAPGTAIRMHMPLLHVFQDLSRLSFAMAGEGAANLAALQEGDHARACNHVPGI